MFTFRSPTGAQEEGEDAVAKLDSELQAGKRLVEEAAEAEQSLSSHVWICTSTHASSKVRRGFVSLERYPRNLPSA